jgi:hypothetical protein
MVNENTLTLSCVGSELEHIFREAGITSMDQLRSEHILTTIHDIRRVIDGADPLCWNASKRRMNARVYNIICALESSDEVNYDDGYGPPEYLKCPLTLRLYEDPVITPCGYTYERSAIEPWVHGAHSDPLSCKYINPNHIFVKQPQHKKMC